MPDSDQEKKTGNYQPLDENLGRRFPHTNLLLPTGRGTTIDELHTYVVSELQEFSRTIPFRYNEFGTVVLSQEEYNQANAGILNRLNGDSKEVWEIFQSLSTFDSEETGEKHLRSRLYYGPGKRAEMDEIKQHTLREWSVTSQSLKSLVDSKFFDDWNNLELSEKALILGVFDYLRDISLKLTYALGKNNLELGSFDSQTVSIVQDLTRSALNIYYSIQLGVDLTNAQSRESLIKVSSIVEASSVDGVIHNLGAHMPRSHREQDNPLEVTALATEIIKADQHYDAIFDFPFGSIGLADSLNTVSNILTGTPLSPMTKSLYFSSYRVGDHGLLDYVPSYQKDEHLEALTDRARHENLRLLLVDDNMVSGGTLLIARKKALEVFGTDTEINTAAVNRFSPGLQDWLDGKYQFVDSTYLDTLIAQHVGEDFDVVYDQIINNLFVRPSSEIEKYYLFPVDNENNPVTNPFILWKAELGEENFNFLDRLGLSNLKQILLGNFGGQRYSNFYEGALDLLDFHPVGEILIDDLGGYIDQMPNIKK